jgi:hypothetical protein
MGWPKALGGKELPGGPAGVAFRRCIIRKITSPAPARSITTAETIKPTRSNWPPLPPLVVPVLFDELLVVVVSTVAVAVPVVGVDVSVAVGVFVAVAVAVGVGVGEGVTVVVMVPETRSLLAVLAVKV